MPEPARTTRHRPAPRAVRIEISLRRPTARASIRLATLAHAIRSTKPTAPSRTRKTVFTGASHSHLVETLDAIADILVCVRISCCETLAQCRNLRLRSMPANPTSQLAKHLRKRSCRFSVPVAINGCQKISVDRKRQPFSHDSDHGSGSGIETNRSSEDRGILAVALFPQCVSQYHYRLSSGFSSSGTNVRPRAECWPITAKVFALMRAPL